MMKPLLAVSALLIATAAGAQTRPAPTQPEPQGATRPAPTEPTPQTTPAPATTPPPQS